MEDSPNRQGYLDAINKIQDAKHDTRWNLKKIEEQEQDAEGLYCRMRNLLDSLECAWATHEGSAACQEITCFKEELRTAMRKTYAAIDKEKERLLKELGQQEEEEAKLCDAYNHLQIVSANKK
jgi:hypothetical protein